jgi:Zn-dependent M28 family amino/carboxypeptidase
VRYDREVVESHNVVGVLAGRDPKLAHEAVVLTAHLDHLGVGAPANGDSIYNGAMDNAGGVATLLEVARALAAPERRPARSVIFVCVTGEERGMLGSYAYAMRPAAGAASPIANLNVDMVLPIVPLDHLVIHGIDESTLGDRSRELAQEAGITLLPDPEPQRRLFIRSDQFSFIRRGIPAIAPMAIAPTGSAEDSLLKQWLRERYHQPSDDLDQPFDPEAVAKLIDYVTKLAARVANDPARPVWKETSYFRRYATTP